MSDGKQYRLCNRCGGKVVAEVATRRLKEFGVIFCTDCRSDRGWLTRVQTKG